MKTHFYTDEIINVCDNNHLTVDEIFEALSKKFPKAGKSSIYRNVEELSEKGQLKKVQGAGKKTYFEKTKSKHIHLVDTESGKIVDFDDEDIIGNIKLPNGFKAEDFDIKIFGRFN